MPQRSLKCAIFFGFCSIWLIAASPRAFAQFSQTTGAIIGLVHEEGNLQAGIKNANITIIPLSTGVKLNRRSNAKGEFLFEFIGPGWYTVSAEADGYEQIASSTITNFPVNFSEMSVVELPPLELRKPGAKEIITRKESPSVVAGTTPTTGAIRGTVHEENNLQAGVGNALVTVLHLDTLTSLTMRSNSKGEFLFEFVKPGKYRVSVEAEGYAQTANSTITDFVVNFNQVSVVRPPLLELRKAGAAPVITGPTPASGPPAASINGLIAKRLVNLEYATRGAGFDDRALLALPFAGNRTFDQLALLAAGVAPSPQAIGETTGPGVGPGVGTSGQFAVNGLRSRANNFTVDGSDNNDEDIGVRRQGFTALVPQSIESLQGFYIATLLPLPQFGRNLGAQVNAISRGGERQVHGAIYGFYTDRRLKSRDFFDLTGGTDDVLRRASVQPGQPGRPVLLLDAAGRRTIPLRNPVAGETPFTRGQYGFTIGGPLTRGDSFFFGSFERRDINASRESNFAVPTVAERGLFRSGETGLIVRADNRPGEAFPTTVRADSYFSLFPFPNNPRGPYGANTYTEILPAGAGGSILSLKLNDQLEAYGKQYSLTGRYNFTDDETTLPATGEALFSSLRARVRTQNLSIFFTGPLGPFANEARLSYGRTRLGFDEVRNPFLLPSGLQGVPFLLNAKKLVNFTLPSSGETLYESRSVDTESDTALIGQVIVSGYSPLGVDVLNFPQSRVNNTFQAADTLFYGFARHRLTAGADVRRTQLNSRLDRNFRSVAIFSGALDVGDRFGVNNIFLPNTNGFFRGVDFMAAGAATGFFQTLSLTPDATIGLRLWQANFFVQDQINVAPNFKLTLGLRYELNTVPTEVNRRIESTFDSPEVRGFIAEEQRLFGRSGLERHLAGRDKIFNGDHNNIAPHIAFAWDPFRDGRTSVRAGYGVYYDQIPGAVISQSRSVFPRFLTINLASISNRGCINEGAQRGCVFLPFNPATLATPGTLNQLNLGSLLSENPTQFLISVNRQVQTDTGSRDFFPATPGFVLPNADLATPYAQHWSLTLEREAGPGLLVSLAYAGAKGTRLLRFATPNLGPNAIPIVTGGNLTGGSDVVFRGLLASPGSDLRQGADFRRPFPLLGSFTSIESDVNSIYHALQAEASLRLTRGFQFTAAYTWSHAIDEVSDLFDLAGARGIPQNSFNRSAERGDANFDVRHRFVNSFIWDLPIFTRSKLLGGWQLAGIVTLQTGQPFTPISSVDVNLDGSLTDRLNTLGGVREVNRGSLRFEFPSAQADQLRLLARAGADGAVGRNTLRAPGVAVMDLAVNKTFRFTERHQIEWRTEFFNLFNRTHFGIPAHTLFSPGLGHSTQTTVPALTAQFAVRYKF